MKLWPGPRPVSGDHYRTEARLWLVGRWLLIGSLVPLVIALWALTAPVSNPGVQACGSPLWFVIDSGGNSPVDATSLDDATAEALRAQPRCTQRVDQRMTIAMWSGGAFVALALTGAVLGLVDDRRSVRSAPDLDEVLPETGR